MFSIAFTALTVNEVEGSAECKGTSYIIISIHRN